MELVTLPVSMVLPEENLPYAPLRGALRRDNLRQRPPLHQSRSGSMTSSLPLLIALSSFALGAMFASTPVKAQPGPLGFFTDHSDVGAPAIAGGVEYDPERQAYDVTASGTNMWSTDDEFHFIWRELAGDFLIRTHARFLGEGVDPHRKLGVIFRANLDADSPYVDAAVHGDGLTSMQFRRAKGAETEQIEMGITAADVIQLERRGDRFIMGVARYGDPFVFQELTDVTLPDTVLAGLFLCSHNPEVVERAIFENVRIVIPPPAGFQPYRDFIGSNLEIMDLETGHRQIIFRHPQSIQAPNWTVDGEALIYNGDGLLYRFDLATGTPEQIDTGDVTRNNNDHVLTFDGTMLGISSTNEALGGSSIYTVPVTGGTPTEITTHAPSYLHGWSPDAKWLVYTAERGDGNYDVYKIPAAGGEEVRLTTAEGLDDGPEFTPDGEWIYFNSARSGLMQLWRMRPDGTDQQQVTDDEFNNWFPHVSPDGRSIVFISYGQDVEPADHPFYKHVYLRQMPIEGGAPRVLAYVFGGQGTINVPSFSPDGKRIAFVSNSDLP